MLNENRGADRGSQISVLRDGDQSLLYCCHSRRTDDMAGNPHVLSVGIDLVPALRSHSVDAEDIVASITGECLHHRGEARIPKAAAEAIRGAARVLNIAWVEDALSSSRPHHLSAQHALPANGALRRRRRIARP